MTNNLVPLAADWDSERTWRTFENGTYHQDWGGVELQKSQADLDRYADIIDTTNPDFVIETGTRAGGSALFFEGYGIYVVSIDVAPQFGKFPPRASRVTWVTGSSTDPDIVEFVKQRIPDGARVMVSLDSDHHAPHVKDEIACWAPLVTRGCYLVVEDACFDMWEPDRAKVGGHKIPVVGGPLKAINTMRHDLEQAGFWRDVEIESLSPVSHSPVGWWRRGE